MKRIFFTSLLLLLIVLLSCKKDGRSPLVTTLRPYESGALEVSCGGVVYAEGDDGISARGICWSTHRDPTTSDNKTSNGTGTGNFTSKITGIQPNTLYFIRAYAINKYGTSYGGEESLLTAEGAPPPIVFGKNTYSITVNSAISGGQVLIDEAPILAAGVCWSENSIPTTSNSKSTGTLNAAGIFTCNLTNLEANTTYTLRAFATNSTGTTYGDMSVIQTKYGTLTDIDNNVYYTIKIGNQIWMAENLRVTKYRDGTPIPYITDNTQWTQTPANGAYCYLQNQTSNAKYGALYSWKAVDNIKEIAPLGWHVPSYTEFTDLVIYLGGSNVASSKLKSNTLGYWNFASVYSNSSGFTALPAGNRSYSGAFSMMNVSTNFWTYSTISPVSVYTMFLDNGDYVSLPSTNIDGGYSVRLIKD